MYLHFGVIPASAAQHTTPKGDEEDPLQHLLAGGVLHSSRGHGPLPGAFAAAVAFAPAVVATPPDARPQRHRLQLRVPYVAALGGRSRQKPSATLAAGAHERHRGESAAISAVTTRSAKVAHISGQRSTEDERSDGCMHL